MLQRNLLVYGLGGIIAPFQAIDAPLLLVRPADGQVGGRPNGVINDRPVSDGRTDRPVIPARQCFKQPIERVAIDDLHQPVRLSKPDCRLFFPPPASRPSPRRSPRTSSGARAGSVVIVTPILGVMAIEL